MNPRTTSRPEPYVWVSWITRLLSGEASCVWSAWLRAHYQTAKAPNGFDMGSWQMDHSAMVRSAMSEHDKDGFEVHTEDENLFTLKGKTGVLSGKPDVVAVKDKMGWVVDAKTGSPRASDRVQVLIYMWALPKVSPEFEGVKFRGKVAYKTGYILVNNEEIDEIFVKRLGDLLKEVCGAAEPHKAPSFGECQHCPITPEDCKERTQASKIHEGETDEF